MKAFRMSRAIALHVLGPRHTREGGGSTPRPGRLFPGKDPVPIVQEAGWAPGPFWTGGKSLSHRDSIPDRPARSQSSWHYNVTNFISVTIYLELCNLQFPCILNYNSVGVMEVVIVTPSYTFPHSHLLVTADSNTQILQFAFQSRIILLSLSTCKEMDAIAQ